MRLEGLGRTRERGTPDSRRAPLALNYFLSLSFAFGAGFGAGFGGAGFGIGDPFGIGVGVSIGVGVGVTVPGVSFGIGVGVTPGFALGAGASRPGVAPPSRAPSAGRCTGGAFIPGFTGSVFGTLNDAVRATRGAPG